MKRLRKAEPSQPPPPVVVPAGFSRIYPWTRKDEFLRCEKDGCLVLLEDADLHIQSHG
jgi:hypothetical protein